MRLVIFDSPQGNLQTARANGMDPAADKQHCPTCGQPMKLARVTPRFGGLPELQTFECLPCGTILTKSVDEI